jgi:hydroxypyruvate reductase
MDRPPANPLIDLVLLRQQLTVITRAALAAVDAGLLVTRAATSPALQRALASAAAVDVVAAGKAAGTMLAAFVAASPREARTMLGVGPAGSPVPSGAEWVDAGHPVPTDGSVRGARRALEVARRSGSGDLLVVLLSGGGSALMALPADGVSLEDKQHTVRRLLESGADIYELNTVRKHLSAIKGGRLAAAASGHVQTLAVSDVVGDDLSVIASGPTVPDASTFVQALAVLDRHGGRAAFPAAVVGRLEAGVAGQVPETPAPGDPGLERAVATVIGPQRGALEDASRTARDCGFTVLVIDQPVTGEARDAAAAHLQRVAAMVRGVPRPVCVLSSGETTVTVRGTGRGGRNQEFACAAIRHLESLGPRVVLGSLGTDGIDGPTDAAGAAVDSSTLARAAAAGLAPPEAFLAENDSYTYFDALGDLIRTGPTRTNVGDLQITLVG